MRPVASFSPSELDQPYGTNPLKNIAKGVRDAFCTASPTPFSQEGGPLQWLRDGTRSNLGCPPAPPPVAPPDRNYNTPQGKCAGAVVAFDVPYSYNIIRPDGTTQPFSSVAGQGAYPTPIVNIRESRAGGSIQFFADVGVPGTEGYRVQANVANIALPADNQYSGLQYQVNLRTISGDPDSCSNPAPTYPPSPPRDSPSSPPVINLPPLIYIPIKPEVKIPVTIKPNITINGGINFRIADSIDIQIGPKSVDVYINPTANIDLFPDAPSPGYELPPGVPDDPTGNAGNDGGSGECPDVDIDPVIDKLNQLLDCACDVDSNYQYVNGAVASGESGTILLPVDAYAVRLTLTDFPASPKKEWGGGAAPDVYYAGWTSKISFGGSRDREPIDYQEKTFLVDESTTAFSWTCRQFYSADVLIIRKVPVVNP